MRKVGEGELWIAFRLDKDHSDLLRQVQIIEERSIRYLVRQAIRKTAAEHGLPLPVPTGLRP